MNLRFSTPDLNSLRRYAPYSLTIGMHTFVYTRFKLASSLRSLLANNRDGET